MTASCFLSPQPQDPEGAVVAEAPSTDENPGQVQDELRRVRLRPAGTRDPSASQREQHLGGHLNRRSDSHDDLSAADELR